MSRPHRTVAPHELGWSVSHSDFTTADEALARSVRDQLDLVDPLPCPHTGERLDVVSFGSLDVEMCADCGERFEETA